MAKAKYRVKVKDEQKIIEGEMFVCAAPEDIAHKVGDPIKIVNPYTKFPEECTVCEVCPSTDEKTGEKGTLVKFKASED
ncbi:hypothetical protein ACFLZ2_05845 [Candidatus Margulisiibacteriota bacterium]